MNISYFDWKQQKNISPLGAWIHEASATCQQPLNEENRYFYSYNKTSLLTDPEIHLARQIAARLQLRQEQVHKTLELLDSGATIPFIARYRKERTGALDEVEIREIQDKAAQIRELNKRKETVLQTISGLGQLSPELEKAIAACQSLSELEDLYLPYKPRRRTRATVARERGLESLALAIRQFKTRDPWQLAGSFLSDEVPGREEALQGARDILAEQYSEQAEVRQQVREAFSRYAELHAKVARGKESEAAKYQDYFQFNARLDKCPSHRILAIFRAEGEGLLRVSIAPESERTIEHLQRRQVQGHGPCAEQLRLALSDAYDRLLQPSIETEFRQQAKEKADQEAIAVFAENLRQLLLASPLGEKSVLAIDPGFRSGCKVVCLDEQGALLEYCTIFPHPPQQQSREAAAQIRHLLDIHDIRAVAIGNGTAGKETYHWLQNAGLPSSLQLFMVNENGASVYSASALAREEFPELDLTVRGAVSIGRRLMDPLAELVKIDPKSIGVGQYQHDVNQSQLRQSLDRTVESCVNKVGVQVNTASKALLTSVSGLGPALAEQILRYRDSHGPFKSRAELKAVPRLGEKAFEQCAGFLRIRQAANPLDNTAVHPESYPIVQQMAKDLQVSVAELISQASLRKQLKPENYINERFGPETLRDILAELEKPGLDPRGEARAMTFDKAVQSIEDLSPGQVLPGIVSNLTKFGAFVDMGVKQDGMVHISEIANRFIRDPAEVLRLGQEVQVKVLEVDLARKRIQLSIKQA